MPGEVGSMMHKRNLLRLQFEDEADVGDKVAGSSRVDDQNGPFDLPRDDGNGPSFGSTGSIDLQQPTGPSDLRLPAGLTGPPELLPSGPKGSPEFLPSGPNHGPPGIPPFGPNNEPPIYHPPSKHCQVNTVGLSLYLGSYEFRI